MDGFNRDPFLLPNHRHKDDAIGYQWDEINLPGVGGITPEKRLLVALLMDAVEHVRGVAYPGVQPVRQEALRRQDRAWIESEDKSYPYSFPNVCHVLGLSCEAVRKAVFKS